MTKLVASTAAAPRSGSGSRLLLAGIIGPPLFTVVYIAEGVRRDGFDAARELVSHLSLGPGGWAGAANLLGFGTLTLALAVGMRRTLPHGRGSTWGPRLVGIAGVGLIAAGIFPIDPGIYYPPDATAGYSAFGAIHQAAGGVVFISLSAACLVFARYFGRSAARSAGWATYSVVSGVLTLAFWIGSSIMLGLDYAGAWHEAPAGLLERLSLIIGATWMFAVALRLGGTRDRRYQWH